ncbi:hypothetical protein BCV69DRAFT_283683 [Microstroma glucosiphilum]|uniref:DnaJ-domain-containing protein n=1 Tax=Pseudomicrostroma glucosiphilum TaxID=1684307 RepID=A0A316U4F6_9BASI|nr:hypothetical protein BCV69DRAFT_283683 [Pseudomicrostroma glucosiphilum]PWN20146.1 hypothetical protein BCV69DRAFT_283683 [Pseudomicrostroma glucosiphilum]
MLLLSPSLGGSSSSRRSRPLRRTRLHSSLLFLLLALFLALTTLVIAASSPSYYKLLDIDPSADAKTIKKAYRRLAQRLHPDKHPEKEEEFVKMSEAYQVLSDEELRKVYDKFGEDGVKRHQAGKAGGASNDPFDVFRNFFGGGRQDQQVRKGQSKQFNLLLDLQQIYLGHTFNLEYERKVVCNTCDGSGARSKEDMGTCGGCQGRGVRIVTQEIMPGFRTQMQTVCNICSGTGIQITHKCSKCNGQKLILEKAELEVEIDPGTEEGEVYVFEGEADEEVDSGIEAGDIIVRVNSDRSHPSLFRRRSSHLYLTRTLTLPDALLGFTDSFQHMDGRNITLSRTGVTQTGWVGTIEGEGMPIRSSKGKRGNLYVEYELVLPERVEGDMLKVLEKAFGRKALKATTGGAHTHEEL